MKNVFKMTIVAFMVIMVIGLTACGKGPKVEPFSIDPATLLFIGSEGDWRALDGDTSGLKPLITPWTYTECTNLDYLDIGEESCGRCPTCEGKTTVVMNSEPFTGSWQDFAFLFPPFPEGTKWTEIKREKGKPPKMVPGTYNRVRIRVRYYYDDFTEVEAANSKVMVSFVNDPEGNWRGPSDGVSTDENVPLKQFNLTNGPLPHQLEEEEMPFGSRDGAAGISSNKGFFFMPTEQPQILLFQTAHDPEVAYIEITEVTFFRGEEDKKED